MPSSQTMQFIAGWLSACAYTQWWLSRPDWASTGALAVVVWVVAVLRERKEDLARG